MTTVSSFVNRLNKIGITVELSGNYPWVYLDSVNGYPVHERFYANHGFTVFFSPVRSGQKETISDISVVFKKIRQMLTEEGRKQDYQSYLEFMEEYQS